MNDADRLELLAALEQIKTARRSLDKARRVLRAALFPYAEDVIFARSYQNALNAQMQAQGQRTIDQMVEGVKQRLTEEA